jgi:hypothetical protein
LRVRSTRKHLKSGMGYVSELILIILISY